MKKSKSILSLLLTVILIVGLGFTVIAGIGKSKTGAMKNIKLGLDLAGGVSITYQVKDKNPTKEEMSDTIYKLQKRVEQYSTEASVYQEGDDRINIEIPGVTDANKILDELGKPGSLSFQTADGETVLTGTDVKSASAKSGQDDMGNKEYSVELNLTKLGTKKFATATQNNIGKQIAIIYDGETISSPVVQSAITGGQAYITGDFTYEEADNLASTIRIGGLKLELEELRSNVVGAQLGEQALSTSLKAGVIGLILVFLFMILVYRLPGLASSLALLIYTEIVLVILNAFDVTLTLPGIAGIILSIGMAVDANVIIFARVREEMAKGKTVKSSLKAGFQKAMSAIVDGNVTTLIAAAVLWFKGSGTGNRYCGIHVYRTGDHTYDRICILWNRNPQRESVLSSDERKKAGEFPRKEEDILQRFHCTDPCRICDHGSQFGKGKWSTGIQSGFPGRNFYECEI